jgi:DNA-binding CsgD family transcriptional regulator/PAS domain-containing protein
MKDRDPDQLIADIYASIFEPVLPIPLLGDLVDYVDSDIGVLTEERPASCEVSAVTPVGMSLESAQCYVDRYAAGSVLLRESARFTRPGAIFCDHMITRYSAYVESVAYQEYFSPLGAEHMLKLQLEYSAGWVTSLVFRRSKRQGPYAEGDLRHARQIASHLVHSFRQRRRLMRERVTASPVAAAIEQLGMALVIVDARSRIRFANRPAERLLSLGRFVTVKGGRLEGAEPLADKALRRLLSAARGAHTCESPAAALLSEACNDGGMPATVTAMPLGPWLAGRMGLASDPATMLLIDTPQQPAGREAESRLADMFSLTPTESAIALALQRGYSVSEIASFRGSTREAVRFHLKNLFDKLGVHSQSQLVHRVSESLRLLWAANADGDWPGAPPL